MQQQSSQFVGRSVDKKTFKKPKTVDVFSKFSPKSYAEGAKQPLPGTVQQQQPQPRQDEAPVQDDDNAYYDDENASEVPAVTRQQQTTAQESQQQEQEPAELRQISSDNIRDESSAFNHNPLTSNTQTYIQYGNKDRSEIIMNKLDNLLSNIESNNSQSYQVKKRDLDANSKVLQTGKNQKFLEQLKEDEDERDSQDQPKQSQVAVHTYKRDQVQEQLNLIQQKEHLEELYYQKLRQEARQEAKQGDPEESHPD